MLQNPKKITLLSLRNKDLQANKISNTFNKIENKNIAFQPKNSIEGRRPPIDDFIDKLIEV